ncbi:uncharacterized protein [Narcine bancroftii]|uniref:uncharacterized protein n=1 Tax=Narcine bancroftii TaxID=1343680 RepID=UPI003831EB5E
MLDPVSREWPECIQAVAAIAVLVEESRKFTFGGSLIVFTPHTVRTILTQKSHRWLTDSRILKYEAILMEKDDLMICTDKSLNPSQFLYSSGEDKEPEDSGHGCSEVVELQMKSQNDLEEEPLLEGQRWFIDGSSSCIDGKRYSGYAIVDGVTGTEVETGRLPGSWSIQSCELYALMRALEWQEDLKAKGLLAPSPPLDFPIHSVNVGDWVLIKSWKEEKLQPRWNGPYLVLLTTETAVRMKEKGWTHASRIMGPVDPPPAAEGKKEE